MRFINGKPVVRCSSLDQLISCPASRTIAAKLRIHEEDDSASWEGQWAHHQAAQRFITFNGAMAPEAGLPGPNIPKGYKPESFAEWIVEFYHRAVMEETPGDWAMEVEGEMLWEFEDFWLSGHCDVYAVAPDASALNFDDLKSGMNIVDTADCNWQVLGYAALFKLIFDALKRIRGRIIQPRVKEGEGKRISGVVIDERGVWNDDGENVAPGVNIQNFIGLLVEKVKAALNNPMRLATGIKQCRWCPADLQCPAQIAERTKVEMELTKEALDAIEAQPNDEVLARWALAKKMLGNKLEKAWGIFKERLEAVEGQTFENADGIRFLLKPWQGRREVTEEGKKVIWESVCNDLDEDRAFGVMNLSLEELERAYAAQLDIPIESKKKDSGEAQVANRFGKYISRKQGKQLTILV